MVPTSVKKPKRLRAVRAKKAMADNAPQAVIEKTSKAKRPAPTLRRPASQRSEARAEVERAEKLAAARDVWADIIGIWPGDETDEQLAALIRGDQGVSGRYLLDTNIVVHLMRAKGPAFEASRRHFGIADPKTVRLFRSVGTFGISKDVRQAYVEIDVFGRSRNPARTMGKNDIGIAAAAKAAGIPVVTTDKDSPICTASS